MKKHLLITAALLTFASGAWAADESPKSVSAPAAASARTGRHQITLEEARKHAHTRADKLDKMTEEEWTAKREKSREHREAWKKMTPEQKEAFKKERKEMREKWSHMTPEEKEAMKKEHLAKIQEKTTSTAAPAAPAVVTPPPAEIIAPAITPAPSGATPH